MVSKGQDRLCREIMANLDFLEGSLVLYRLKCGKHCTCNDGNRHPKWFLSTKDKGRTKNYYIPVAAVTYAQAMHRRYQRLLAILKKLSRANYKALMARTASSR
ncbi:MAG: DUF6788 family protein [Planctomycetota bacterium]